MLKVPLTSNQPTNRNLYCHILYLSRWLATVCTGLMWAGDIDQGSSCLLRLFDAHTLVTFRDRQEN